MTSDFPKTNHNGEPYEKISKDTYPFSMFNQSHIETVEHLSDVFVIFFNYRVMKSDNETRYYPPMPRVSITGMEDCHEFWKGLADSYK